MRKRREKEIISGLSARVVIVMEVKILKNEANELSFELVGADQALPNMIVDRLNKDKSVEFAACKLAHPLLANPVVYVRTRQGKALDAIVSCIKELKDEVDSFKGKFEQLTR